MAKNNALLITSYIIVLALCIFISKFAFGLINSLNIYYCALLVPILILMVVLNINFTIKLAIHIFAIIFGRNDNVEVLSKIDKINDKINEIIKYSLLIILFIILIITMILDIILCITKNKMMLLVLSIIIWISLIYTLIKEILIYKK